MLPDPYEDLTEDNVKQVLDGYFPADSRKEPEGYKNLTDECHKFGITKVAEFCSKVCVNIKPLLRDHPDLGHCGLARAALWPDRYGPRGLRELPSSP